MKRYNVCVRTPMLVSIVALVAMGLFAKRGWLDWRRMVRHNVELGHHIENARSQSEDLDKQIHALESSTFAQEQAVRQHLGYLRRDELVIER